MTLNHTTQEMDGITQCNGCHHYEHEDNLTECEGCENRFHPECEPLTTTTTGFLCTSCIEEKQQNKLKGT